MNQVILEQIVKLLLQMLAIQIRVKTEVRVAITALAILIHALVCQVLMELIANHKLWAAVFHHRAKIMEYAFMTVRQILILAHVHLDFKGLIVKTHYAH